MGMRDVKYREVGTLMIIARVGGKYVKMCYLGSTLDSFVWNHIGNLMKFTQNSS